MSPFILIIAGSLQSCGSSTDAPEVAPMHRSGPQLPGKNIPCRPIPTIPECREHYEPPAIPWMIDSCPSCGSSTPKKRLLSRPDPIASCHSCCATRNAPSSSTP
jgi:hypothetical protein